MALASSTSSSSRFTSTLTVKGRKRSSLLAAASCEVARSTSSGARESTAASRARMSPHCLPQ